MDPGPVSLRALLVETSRLAVAGCLAQGHDETPPLVYCARHKALAVDAELEALAGNEETTMLQLETIRDTAIAAGHQAEEVTTRCDAVIANVRAAAAAKRASLQTEAVAVDAALECALAAVAALDEAAASLDDAELAARVPTLLEQEGAARAAVAAIPASPTTTGFLGLTAPAPSSPELLRDAPADALFGRVLVAPVLAPHTHTPHCVPACAVRFAPHTHSVACNHAPSPVGPVWFSTVLRDQVASLEKALTAGGSTEELAEARRGRAALLSGRSVLQELDDTVIRQDLSTPLFWFAGLGHLEAVQVLVAAGADTMVKTTAGHTPLHVSAMRGRDSIIALLLSDPRVDAVARDADERCPLYFAAANGRDAAVRLLLGCPKIASYSAGSMTPLHRAVWFGHTDVVSMLIADSRIEPNARDKVGSTPLHDAATQGHDPIISMLLASARVDPTLTDKFGQTPLHWAARRGYVSSVDLLLADARIDPRAKDEEGRTALDHARGAGRSDVVASLKAALAKGAAPTRQCVVQ